MEVPRNTDASELAVYGSGSDSDPDSDRPSLTAESGGHGPRKHLSYWDGLALVVSLQIGSGIFTAPAQVSRHVASPAAGVAVWLLAGLVVWTGAASFMELGMAITENGGPQEFLRECYGNFMGCLFTWTWVLISKPSSMAAIATVCAEHGSRALYPGATTPPQLVVTALGLSALWLITTLNWTSLRAGARLASGFFVLKVAVLAAIAAMGLTWTLLGRSDGAMKSPHGWFGADPTSPVPRFADQAADFVTAVFGALFCYNGWETISFLLGDMDNLGRDLPRITRAAIVIVMSGFVLVDMSLYAAVPIRELRGTNAPVLLFADKILGPAGGLFFSVFIAASAMGALNTNVFVTATLCVAASRRRYFPAILANEHSPGPAAERLDLQRLLSPLPRTVQSFFLWVSDASAASRWEKNIPIYAMLFNSCLATLFFSVGTFDTLVHFTGLSQYLFFLLAVLGVFIIRRRRPEPGGLASPYRTYTWNPIIFSLCSSLLVARGVLTDIGQGLALALVSLASWLVYKYSLGRE